MRCFVLLLSMVTSAAWAGVDTPFPSQQTSQLSLVSPLQAHTDESAILRLRLVSLEIHLLEVQRQSLGPPILVSGLGATGFLGGAAFLVSSYTAVYGLVIMGAAALPLAIGLVWLFGTLDHNRYIAGEVEKLKREHENLGAITSAPPQIMNDRPSLVLAAF